MSGVWILIRRYALPSGNLTTFALTVAIVGVAIGIAQLMVVLSVMSGFEKVLTENYTRITSDMVVQGKIDAAKLSSSSGVRSITPFFVSQGLIAANGKVAGAVIEGIEVATSRQVIDWSTVFVSGPASVGEKWLWLGEALAKKLGVGVGDDVSLVISNQRGRRTVTLSVGAITKFGIHDHDLHWVRVSSAFFQTLFNVRDPFYKVRVEEGIDLPSARRAIEVNTGGTARLWNELNRNIFLAVSHQKRLLFLVLQVVVALSAVNVVNLLVMNTHFRRRDLAILRAMGLGQKGVFLLFIAQGLIIGSSGVVLGIILGYGISWGVERYQPILLSESVYNVTRLPVLVRQADVLMLSLVALLLCLSFSIFPAWRAMRLPPVEALRNE